MKSTTGVRPRFPGVTVGVTGAIGSGKSQVCSALAALGRQVLSADPMARELMETDENLREQLCSILGAGVYGPEGRLDRRKIAGLIFGDSGLRARVNAVVHPAVFRSIASRLESLPASESNPYVVIEAALVYESGMDRMLNAVVVVDAPPGERLSRVLLRDGSSREDFLAREAAQMKPAEKVRRADFVIRNVGSVEDLVDRARFLDRLFVAMYRPAMHVM